MEGGRIEEAWSSSDTKGKKFKQSREKKFLERSFYSQKFEKCIRDSRQVHRFLNELKDKFKDKVLNDHFANIGPNLSLNFTFMYSQLRCSFQYVAETH